MSHRRHVDWLSLVENERASTCLHSFRRCASPADRYYATGPAGPLGRHFPRPDRQGAAARGRSQRLSDPARRHRHAGRAAAPAPWRRSGRMGAETGRPPRRLFGGDIAVSLSGLVVGRRPCQPRNRRADGRGAARAAPASGDRPAHGAAHRTCAEPGHRADSGADQVPADHSGDVFQPRRMGPRPLGTGPRRFRRARRRARSRCGIAAADAGTAGRGPQRGAPLALCAGRAFRYARGALWLGRGQHRRGAGTSFDDRCQPVHAAAVAPRCRRRAGGQPTRW